MDDAVHFPDPISFSEPVATSEILEKQGNSPEDRRKRALHIGFALTIISTLAMFGSFITTCRLFSEPSAERRFLHSFLNGYGYTRMTITFLIILAWWTLFSVVVLAANIKLTDAIYKSAQERVNRWVLNVSALNALGTNIALVSSMCALLNDESYLETLAGVSMLVIGFLQACLSLALYSQGKDNGGFKAQLSIKSLKPDIIKSSMRY